MSTLVYRHEPPLFALSTAIGILFWLLLIVGTFGIALVYVLLGFLVYLFAHSGFIAHLRGNAVELGAEQFPDLHAQYLDCCRQLGIAKPPTAYLMMSDGILNALATKFLRRHYVVVYSSVVEALRRHPDALRFYFGHELGHIRQNHLDWTLLRWPASLLPLLGTAYRRAQEYTCDSHGLACCPRPADAALAIAVLAAGSERWSQLNLRGFAAQAEHSGGFWMSFHELTQDYPWLSKRLSRVMALAHGQEPTPPRRHPLAWVFALFVPRLGVGAGSGLVSLMVVIAVLGILLAIAIPAYQDYTVRAAVSAALPQIERVRSTLDPMVAANGGYPADLADAGIDAAMFTDPVASAQLTDEGVVFRLAGSEPQMADKTIVLQAYSDDSGKVGWRCDRGTLEPRFRPAACRSGSVLGSDPIPQLLAPK
jgi:Tfp pilus assembly major pilin PilA/Zn-dependent protease with chaperone function